MTINLVEGKTTINLDQFGCLCYFGARDGMLGTSAHANEALNGRQISPGLCLRVQGLDAQVVG